MPCDEKTPFLGFFTGVMTFQHGFVSFVPFVKEIEAKRGTPLKHVNTPYDFRVMTKQEVMLRLYQVKAIRKDEDGVFEASHTMAHPGDLSPAVIDGLDDSRAEQQQLALF